MNITRVGAPTSAEIVSNIYKQQTKPIKLLPDNSAVEVVISDLAKQLNAALTKGE